MFQRGPGEGYHAAKDEALAINPTLRCRKLPNDHWFRVFDGEKVVGRGRIARDAWSDTLSHLRGEYDVTLPPPPSTGGM